MIGNDVWIGYEAVILAGVTIGDGAIIGTRALVTRDVAPYTIVGGVPARELRLRFPEETIAELLTLKWWDWPIELDDRDETGDDLSDRLQKQADDHEINRDQRQKPELLKSCEWVGNCHVRVLSRK